MAGKQITTHRQLLNLKKFGRFNVEPNLFVDRKTNGIIKFIFRTTNKHKPKKNGKSKIVEKVFGFFVDTPKNDGSNLVGDYRPLTLQQARELTQELRVAVESGISPDEYLKPQEVMTFRKVALMWFETKNHEWADGNAKRHLRAINKIFQPLHDLPIIDINRQTLIEVLEPIWKAKPTESNKALGTVRQIIEFADSRAYWPEDKVNPADKKKLTIALGSNKIPNKQRASLPHSELPEFMKRLCALPKKTNVNYALEFYILTGAGTRVAPITKMKISEVDEEGRFWKVPGAKMKNGKPFRVPLCDRAMEIYYQQKVKTRSEYIFPSNQSKTGHINDASMLKITQVQLGYGKKVSNHGFRTVLTDWGKEKGINFYWLEMSKSHGIGNTVAQAYQSDDLLEVRRKHVIEPWSEYCLSLVKLDDKVL